MGRFDDDDYRTYYGKTVMVLCEMREHEEFEREPRFFFFFFFFFESVLAFLCFVFHKITNDFGTLAIDIDMGSPFPTTIYLKINIYLYHKF